MISLLAFLLSLPLAIYTYAGGFLVIDLPDNSTLGFAAASGKRDVALVTVDSMLQPTTLYAVGSDGSTTYVFAHRAAPRLTSPDAIVAPRRIGRDQPLFATPTLFRPRSQPTFLAF